MSTSTACYLAGDPGLLKRGILYFGGQGVGDDILRLLAWTAAIAVLLLLPASRKLERHRERSPARRELARPAPSLAKQA